MRFAGIDIASEKHFVAVVDEASTMLEKSTSFTEDGAGYTKLKCFYDPLILAGKPAKLAVIAAMRKLLHAIYTVAKNRKPFVPRREVTA